MTENKLDSYDNPLTERYASTDMNYVFSPAYKFTVWRKLWIELARAEKSLGLPVTDEQIREMEVHRDELNFDVAASYEKKFRHDVMAHIHAFGDLCPTARPIIHLGATSAFVGDNTDLIQIRDALGIIRTRLVNLIRTLRGFALAHRDLPTLGFTHFQPAQLTTVGKRASLWLQDLVIDYRDLVYLFSTLRFRGVKGTTGTQASFLNLFDGDHEKVKKLDRMVAQAFGFESSFMVTGQTYPRKVDARVAALLSGIAQSVSKLANDIRLLSHLREVEEPFESTQIGSSAMPYKRNPMRSERMNSLARFILSLESSPAFTASAQWLERTLDDSANKRLALPQMFLGVDAILLIAGNVTVGLVVNSPVIMRNIERELPFIASEDILMQAVKRGGDRQELHEEIRRLSHETAKKMKAEGTENDLIDRIVASGKFNLTRGDIDGILEPTRYTGRASGQVAEFIEAEVDPLLAGEQMTPGENIDLKV